MGGGGGGAPGGGDMGFEVGYVDSRYRPGGWMIVRRSSGVCARYCGVGMMVSTPWIVVVI